ncbi:hypothetical protein DET54_11496 [Paenibacillus pabuli]|uniref:Group-specific protein n=1 Tax=Paenibacillus pabuli TaxID=1472 RepID=A0ABX9BEW8_9BACL|nr:group-specific protein [Paenibacillus pabuli]RAI89628.1 hypothetical protein DET54_11496 [Paenibacillus pabuli]
MNNFISINIDEAEVKKICHEKIEKLIREVDSEKVFWDSKELTRRTCLSWNTIQHFFFFDQRFPKHKVGGKWLFPAKETRSFLEQWLKEQ